MKWTFSAWAAVAALMVAGAPAATAATGVTYYVDSAGGHDSAAGTSAQAAWQSLAKVNATTFAPGDRILLKSGDSWTGQLWPKGSGVSTSPITIGSYGAGSLPAVKGAGGVADAVKLWNQQYWAITGIDVSNQAPATSTPGANLRDLRGIHVGGDNGTQLNGFVVDNVRVHDVTGLVNWIGGSTSGNRPGITFATGWDRSKNTGGIVFEPWVAHVNAPGSATTLHGITVTNSTIQNTSFAGIVVKQYTGNDPGAVSTGWGTRTGPSDSRFAPNTDILVRHNYITQAGTPYGCDGVYITGSRRAVIEDNVVDHTGVSGIESYYTDQVTIQHNEVFGTRAKAGGSDSNAMDADIGTTAQILQYNYVADNGDGIFVFQQQFGDSVVRYNVLVDNVFHELRIQAAKTAHGQLYGNTVYDRAGYLVYASGNAGAYALTDNILYSTAAQAKLDTSGLTYDHNLYHGTGAPGSDHHALVADPRFVNPTPIPDVTGTPRTVPNLGLANGFAVKSGSPAVNSGVAVANNGGVDYAGSPLYNGGPDRGAFELAAR
jgi:parallel beta-helix repeat protein